MNGQRVGTWSQDRATHSLQYDPAWIASPAGRPLSLSLPFPPRNVPLQGAAVANYFDNLLPDSADIRNRLRDRFGIGSTEAFPLLAAIGRDCIGAVQLLPEGAPPDGFDRVEAVPLSDADVEREIATSLSGARTLGQPESETLRISLAGAQEKTALLFHRNKWCRPVGATPTTHILKLPLGLIGGRNLDMHDSVENEWLCAQILRAYGLDIAACEILEFGSRKVLAVERFDRARTDEGWIARLPQEDFCQAFGLPNNLKYESDGGPGMRVILRILETSSNAAADTRAFMKAQVIYWLLAATDGHAKNFSLFHERDGKYRLTPFYDVLSSWPIIGTRENQLPYQKAKLAMCVRSKNPHWKLAEIHARHWLETGKRSGVPDMPALLGELVETTPTVLDRVAAALPKKFPAAVADRILAGIRRSAKTLASDLST
jgi:serine/threonine-protein kinase HipA